MRAVVLPVLVLCCLVLSGCSSDQSKGDKKLTSKKEPRLTTIIDQKSDKTKFDQLLRAGVEKLEAKKYDAASACFNLALQVQPKNSHLHFLNALNYELMSRDGNDRLEVARAGYEQALQFNPNNVLAAECLGLLHTRQQNYSAAKEILAKGLMLAPENTKMLHSLAIASYFTGDVDTAYKAISQARKHAPENARYLKTATMVYGAVGKKDEAQTLLSSYEKVGEARTYNILKKRLEDWESFHNEKPVAGKRPTQLAQVGPGAAPHILTSAAQGSSERMCIVDVTILSTEEVAESKMGVNLLSQLKMNFGMVDGGGVFGRTAQSQRLKDNLTGTNLQWQTTKTITRAFGLTGLDYSLNIANAINKSTEILARPTLIALDGLESKFISGNKLVIGIAGVIAGGQIDQLDLGTTLKFTPRFIDDDTIQLDVYADRSTPETNLVSGLVRLNTNATTANPLDTTLQLNHSMVQANVVMKFGQSLILSGISSKTLEKGKDGVPFLKDLPILQYFFSTRNNSAVTSSVVFVLTPRRAGFGPHKASMNEIKREERGENLDRFLNKHMKGLNIAPNIHATFKGLESNAFYEQFRTGDVGQEHWMHVNTVRHLVTETLNFIYF